MNFQNLQSDEDYRICIFGIDRHIIAVLMYLAEIITNTIDL